ncbi:MAG: choice-of-anchor tandem repeat GloVer-containing protein [Bryobacteraceae bacterium]|jgi:uncharacterized repeat protein (TIGR03803 family)
MKFQPKSLMIGAPLMIGMLCSAATPPVMLYSFPGQANGAFPEAGLVFDATINVLYGTTYAGGAAGLGTVFQFSPPTSPATTWNKKEIFGFSGADGANPLAGLVVGPNLVLYGTTNLGGAAGYGTVFQLTPPAPPATTWTETVLYSFAGGNDGINPRAGLVLNSSTGVLYGTTYAGGAANYGTVFSLTPPVPPATIWTEQVIFSFTGGTDGGHPEAGLTLASTGVLYGTTYSGGSAGWGVVFELAPATGGGWTQRALYTFSGGADGGSPEGGLTLGQSSVLYGTASFGGDLSANHCPLNGIPSGCGVVFRLVPSTGNPPTWTESVLHAFEGPPGDGTRPSQNLVASSNGALFGTTFAGAYSKDVCFPSSYIGCGIVYQLAPPTVSGGAWTEHILAAFDDTDGGGPNGVIFGPSGALYGTTRIGGSASDGTIFQVVP